MVLGLTGCQTSKETSVADDVDKAYPDAVSVLQKGWDQIPEQFPAPVVFRSIRLAMDGLNVVKSPGFIICSVSI